MTQQQEILYKSALTHTYLWTVLKIFYLSESEYNELRSACLAFVSENDILRHPPKSPMLWPVEVVENATKLIKFYKDQDELSDRL